ncbi:Holliday junction resolvase RuvX [Sphingobium sp. B12D2B]|uniref:Holliday junction resolvase RuvX n=1 Tax=Sphingobium sp. B12D2B TaxID=2940577 RepID=UPI002223F497|nr:Holliday junction resolvase RuvX [Sphingobium sp. B12D2B]MCW2350776.1 putative Holliday junction resolvase [Sphingobium sp. B12D2B]
MVGETLITLDKASFAQALPAGGRLLGMDLGTQTIGLSLCDAGWSIASPAHTHKRSKFSKDREVLAQFIAQQSVKGLVIGLPLNMDGSESPRSQAARAFARNIAVLGLPVLLWDERWSTVAAERAMIAQDMSRAKRAEKIDAHAAALILQGAIDGLTMG